MPFSGPTSGTWNMLFGIMSTGKNVAIRPRQHNKIRPKDRGILLFLLLFLLHFLPILLRALRQVLEESE